MLFTLPLNYCLLPASTSPENEAESSGSMLKLLRIFPVILMSLVIVVLSITWIFIDPILEPHLRQVIIRIRSIYIYVKIKYVDIRNPGFS